MHYKVPHLHRLATCVIVLNAAQVASADATFLFSRDDSGAWRFDESTGGESPRADAFAIYNNYTPFNPPSNEFGRTVLDSDLRVGGAEVGDDLDTTFAGQGIIDNAGWSFVNLSNSGLIGFAVRLTWYDAESLARLGSFSLNADFSRLILPGERIRIGGDPGALRFLRVPVTQQMFFTTQYLETRGIDLADAGATYGGPHNVGSSSRFAFNFTTNQQIDLGGRDENLGYFISVFPIPTPGAAGVLAVAGLFAARRRR